MDATERFLQLIRAPAHDIELDVGALLIAAHADPSLDFDLHLGRLDELAAGVRPADLDGLRHHLFGTTGFSGRTDGYYAPENSFLDRVLESRRGIPITLSVLTMEVGRRVGVPLVGVGMPGHFLVRTAAPPFRFVDPFHGGAELDDGDCERLFHTVAGTKAPFRATYLEPVDAVAILGRMTANLVHAYRRADDRRGLRWSARLRAGCPGVGPAELLQLAIALRRGGATDEAAVLIDRALPGLAEPEADRWRAEAHRLRALLN